MCNNSTSSADTKCIIFLSTLVQDMSFLKVAIATDYKKCHCCEFSLARETFFKSYFAWIMKKGSVYTQVINSRSVKDVLKGIMIMNKHLNNVLINICCINGAILISPDFCSMNKLDSLRSGSKIFSLKTTSVLVRVQEVRERMR